MNVMVNDSLVFVQCDFCADVSFVDRSEPDSLPCRGPLGLHACKAHRGVAMDTYADLERFTDLQFQRAKAIGWTYDRERLEPVFEALFAAERFDPPGDLARRIAGFFQGT